MTKTFLVSIQERGQINYGHPFCGDAPASNGRIKPVATFKSYQQAQKFTFRFMEKCTQSVNFIITDLSDIPHQPHVGALYSIFEKLGVEKFFIKRNK